MNRKVRKDWNYRTFSDKFKGVLFPIDFIKQVFETKSEKEYNKVFGVLMKYALTGEFNDNELSNGIRDVVLSGKREFDKLLKKFIVQEAEDKPKPIKPNKPTTVSILELRNKVRTTPTNTEFETCDFESLLN